MRKTRTWIIGVACGLVVAAGWGILILPATARAAKGGGGGGKGGKDTNIDLCVAFGDEHTDGTFLNRLDDAMQSDDKVFNTDGTLPSTPYCHNGHGGTSTELQIIRPDGHLHFRTGADRSIFIDATRCADNNCSGDLPSGYYGTFPMLTLGSVDLAALPLNVPTPVALRIGLRSPDGESDWQLLFGDFDETFKWPCGGGHEVWVTALEDWEGDGVPDVWMMETDPELDNACLYESFPDPNRKNKRIKEFRGKIHFPFRLTMWRQ